jgi:osmotically-inducible protein OsmY
MDFPAQPPTHGGTEAEDWPGAGSLTPDVRELAERRLRGNPYLALKNVSCEYREGVLTLRGRLPTYYLRQVARAAVAGMEGVEAIVDCIEVVPPARDSRRDRASQR